MSIENFMVDPKKQSPNESWGRYNSLVKSLNEFEVQLKVVDEFKEQTKVLEGLKTVISDLNDLKVSLNIDMLTGRIMDQLIYPEAPSDDKKENKIPWDDKSKLVLRQDRSFSKVQPDMLSEEYFTIHEIEDLFKSFSESMTKMLQEVFSQFVSIDAFQALTKVVELKQNTLPKDSFSTKSILSTGCIELEHLSDALKNHIATALDIKDNSIGSEKLCAKYLLEIPLNSIGIEHFRPSVLKALIPDGVNK